MTLQEFVDRAILEAQAGENASQFVLHDADAVAMILVPRALDEVSREVAAEPEMRGELQKAFTLTLDMDGAAALPADFQTEYADLAGFSAGSAIDLTTTPFNRVQHYADFLGFQFTGFIHWCVTDGVIFFRKDNAPFHDVSELTMHGPRSLVEADLASFTAASAVGRRLVSKLALLLRREMK